MARDPSRLRKAYEAKLGKDRVDKLTDQQIGLLSKHYNSLSDGEQSDLDNQIFKGYRTELHEIADSFIEENKPSSDKVSVYTAADKFVDDKKEFAIDGFFKRFQIRISIQQARVISKEIE